MLSSTNYKIWAMTMKVFYKYTRFGNQLNKGHTMKIRMISLLLSCSNRFRKT